MKKQFILFGCMLFFIMSVLQADETKTPDIPDTIQPFAVCAPASAQAQATLDKVQSLLNYQGESIILCRSITIPTLAAWTKLVRMEQHPYVNWKKLPVTQRYISYNPLYMEQLELAQGEVISHALIARQVGHHIKQHTDYKLPISGLDQTPAQVAIADYYAGFILAKLSLSAEQLSQAQQVIFNLSEYPEVTILEQRQRLLLEGWHKAGGTPTTLPDININQRW